MVRGMKLIAYIREHGRKELAAQLRTSPDYLSQIAHGQRRASPKLAKAIEAATGGKVPRHLIRPDVYDAPAAQV